MTGHLRINAARTDTKAKPGPRPTLPLLQTDPAREEAWLEQAVDALFALEETCALDVAERGPQGLMGAARYMGINHSWASRIMSRVRDRSGGDDD